MGLDREESVSVALEAGRRNAIYIFEAMGLQVCSGEDAFATLMILLWAAFACAGPQGGQKWTGQVQVVRQSTEPISAFKKTMKIHEYQAKRHSGEVWRSGSAWRGR